MPDPAKRAKYTGPERRVNPQPSYKGTERRIPFPVRSLYRISWEAGGSTNHAYVLAYSQGDAIDHLGLTSILAVTNVASPVEIYGVDEARPRPVKAKAKYAGVERRKTPPAGFKYSGTERRAA